MYGFGGIGLYEQLGVDNERPHNGQLEDTRICRCSVDQLMERLRGAILRCTTICEQQVSNKLRISRAHQSDLVERLPLPWQRKQQRNERLQREQHRHQVLHVQKSYRLMKQWLFEIWTEFGHSPLGKWKAVRTQLKSREVPKSRPYSSGNPSGVGIALREL